MRESLKIAIYSGEIPSTTFIERLIKGVAETGATVLLFGVLKKGAYSNFTLKLVGYRNHRVFKLSHLLRYGTLLFLFKRKEKKLLDQFLKIENRNDLYTKVKCYPVLWHQPDIFHVQWAKGLEEWIWVQDFGMKLVLSLRGAHINYSPIADPKLAKMYLTNFPKVSGFHAVSEAISIEAQKYGATKECIHVVYSGLPDIKNKRPFINYINQSFQILSVGRPHWKKGYSYALDSCQIMKAAGFKFEYNIVGGAGDIELMYQVRDLELQDYVTLLKQQSYDSVQTLMKDADLLLLPSIEEGVANVVLEAMAIGTLVLSTDCGGMKEVIQHGENGFIVPIRNSQAIADMIIVIQNLSLDESTKVKSQALATINNYHTESSMVSGMLALYEFALKK